MTVASVEAVGLHVAAAPPAPAARGDQAALHVADIIPPKNARLDAVALSVAGSTAPPPPIIRLWYGPSTASPTTTSIVNVPSVSDSTFPYQENDLFLMFVGMKPLDNAVRPTFTPSAGITLIAERQAGTGAAPGGDTGDMWLFVLTKVFSPGDEIKTTIPVTGDAANYASYNSYGACYRASDGSVPQVAVSLGSVVTPNLLAIDAPCAPDMEAVAGDQMFGFFPVPTDASSIVWTTVAADVPGGVVVTDGFAWWSTSSGSDQGQLAAVMTVNKGGTGAPRFTASLTGTAPNLTGPVALALVYPTRRPANDCWVWDGTAEQPASVLLWDGSTEIPTTLEVAP